jgi:hypothetical protein
MAALKPFPITGFSTVEGSKLNLMVTALNNATGNGTPQAITASTLTATSATTGNLTQTAGASTVIAPQIVTAAGATQGNATVITGSKAVITVATTASTHGVKLPVAVTGLEVEVANAATFGVKVYPATGDKIGAASTNAADTVLAINKTNRYIGVNTTLWVVQRGA